MGGFAWHQRYNKVPHRTGGRQNEYIPARVKGGDWLVPHQLIFQRVKASGWKLSKASDSFSPVLPSVVGYVLAPSRPPAVHFPFATAHLQPTGLCFPHQAMPFDCLLLWLREDQPHRKAMSRCSPLSSSHIFLSCPLSPTFSSSFILSLKS